MMKVVFMGTPDFAVPCLHALIEAKVEVVGVVSQPDSPSSQLFLALDYTKKNDLTGYNH